MNRGRQRSLERLFKRARKHLTTINCQHCEYDEAEGILMNHCPKCCHKIVSEMWKAFIISSDAIAVAAKPRLYP